MANWLIERALGVTTAQELLTGCCERLVAAGIPISRAHVGFRTLHPLFRAVTLTWRPGEVLELHELSHGELPEAFRNGPHYPMVTSGIGRVRHRLEVEAGSWSQFALLRELHAAGATEYVAWAVSFGAEGSEAGQDRDGLIGSWTTQEPGGFSDDDFKVLKRIERRLAVACKVTIKEQITRNILSAYLGPHAAERVYAGSISRGSGENIHAVIWFADLRDSTRLSDEMPLPEFLSLLNDFFECIAGPVLEHGGEVLRFVGDAVLAVFPMPQHLQSDPRTCPVHRAACATALDAARAAMARVAALNTRRIAAGCAPLGYGIGMHVGDVMYGNIGVPARVEFSVVGATANHAAKIEGLCKDLQVPLIVSSEFAQILPGPWISLGRRKLPGVAQPQEVCTLAELASGRVSVDAASG